MKYTDIIDNCPLGWHTCHCIHTDSDVKGKWLCDWKCSRQTTCKKHWQDTYNKYYKHHGNK